MKPHKLATVILTSAWKGNGVKATNAIDFIYK